jgi:SAM-dependent methyltransferase
VDAEVLALLLTPQGERALARATELAAESADPLAAATALRAAGFPPDLASAALTQVDLRGRAGAKFGADASCMYFTRTGLEQATRAVVARRRAGRLAAAGAARVADLGCGIGSDAVAFARAGLTVMAVDADRTTAVAARANVAALGLDHLVTVECADAATVDLSTMDAVFCDPARRDGARGRRVFDPAGYSPPWPFVLGLAERVRNTVLKLAPGIDHALVPDTAEAEWVSVDGDVVEAALWCGPLAGAPRRATVLRGQQAHQLTGTGAAAASVGPLRRYLLDPDGAVVRAHLVAELAATMGGTLADARIAYVFSDAPVETPFGRCFEVLAEVPFAHRQLRGALRERGIGRLEIRKRGIAVEPGRLRHDLKLSGDCDGTLVLTRIGKTPTALLCRSHR